MKKLLCLLASLVMITAAAAGLAESLALRTFVGGALDRIASFDPQRQALVVTVPSRSGQTVVTYQIAGDLSQFRLVETAGTGTQTADLQFNGEAVWAASDAASGSVSYVLYYSDLKDILTSAIGLLGGVSGLGTTLDTLGSLDYGSLTEAVISLCRIVTRAGLTIEKSGENTVLRFRLDRKTVLTAVDSWLTEAESKPEWLRAAASAMVVVTDILKAAGSNGADTQQLAAVAGQLSTDEGLKDAIARAHQEIDQQLVGIGSGEAGNTLIVDAALTVDSRGDFVSLRIDIAEGTFLDARYEGESLVIVLGTDGRERVVVTAVDASCITIEYYRGTGSPAWRGYAKQEAGADGWTLSVWTGEYSADGTGSATPVFTASVREQTAIPAISEASPTRITWNWLMSNIGTLMTVMR